MRLWMWCCSPQVCAHAGGAFVPHGCVPGGHSFHAHVCFFPVPAGGLPMRVTSRGKPTKVATTKAHIKRTPR